MDYFPKAIFDSVLMAGWFVGWAWRCLAFATLLRLLGSFSFRDKHRTSKSQQFKIQNSK
jgi:hypothetical protein